MIIYLTFFSALGLLGIATTPVNQRKWLLAVSCIALIIFMGTRYKTGCDYLTYEIRFLRPLEFVTNNLSSSEPGIWWIVLITRELGLSYLWHNILATMLIVWGYFVFASRTTMPLVFLAIIFPIVTIQLGMSGIRQAIALSFLMVSLPALVSRKRLMAAILIIIGGLFHNSVLVFLPLAIIAGKPMNIFRAAFAVIVAMPIIMYGFGGRLDTYSDRYVEQIYGVMESNGALLRYAMCILLVAPFILAHKKLKSLHPSLYPILQQFFIITILAGSLIFVSTVALHRFVFYLFPFAALISVQSLDVILPENQRKLAVVLPIMLSLTYLVGWFLTSSHADRCFVPYQTVIQPLF